jgi:hypothetical protein
MTLQSLHVIARRPEGAAFEPTKQSPRAWELLDRGLLRRLNAFGIDTSSQ